MKFRLTIKKKLFLSHVLAVLLVSGSIGTYFYLNAAQSLMHGLKDRLQYSAALISRTVDAADLEHIKGESDMARPAYIATLQKLRAFRRMNPDIAYLYIMRRTGDRVFFVVDSDETEEQALPGEEYTDVIPTLVLGFTGVSVDDQIYSDEWGSFLSGYSPIKNGMGEYLVGIDMRAAEVADKFRRLRISGFISLGGSILLALLFSQFLAARFIGPINLLMRRCRSIAEGRLEEQVDVRTNDELDDLIGAFHTMSDKLASSEQKKREAYNSLKQARDELEIRVEQRTKDLKEVNEKLRQEITVRVRAERALEEAAMTDPLTTLLNRRAMLEYLKHEVARNQRSHAPFVLLLADLDCFKNINDTYGHDVGDHTLIEISRIIQKSIRGQDTVSRWGGEEFLILLPDTDLKGGVTVAEKIRNRVAEHLFSAGGKIGKTDRQYRRNNLYKGTGTGRLHPGRRYGTV